jgi:2'-5' RNA ligase
VKRRILTFLHELHTIEPSQYYYPGTDFHVTVMSIVSCYPGFSLEQVQVQKYIDAITVCLKRINRFDLSFRGITASSSCVMIQGFPGNQMLEMSRDAVREHFLRSPLQQSIDTRYAIRTAHATVARFRRKPTHTAQFINVLKRYREYDFGTCEVAAYELVFNDWYLRAHQVQHLHTFLLG